MHDSRRSPRPFVLRSTVLSIVATLFVAVAVSEGANAAFPVSLRTSVSFSSCTSSQSNTISQAVTDATVYLANATDYFDNGRHGARYRSWFGTFDQTRWNEVKSTYQAIENMVLSGSIDFDCAGSQCGSNVFAYVYPDDTSPFTVYPCGAFWTAPATGTDSKAGTLIHEWSHYDGTGATDDFAYGKTGAGSLANGDDVRAINNADNYEYFAENDPNTVDNTPTRVAAVTSHAFGSVSVGSSSTVFTFIVSNGGDAALSVGTVSATPSFALVSDTCSNATVVPLASCSIGVVFVPASATTITGSLSVPNNAAAGTLTLGVNGVGTASSTPPPTAAALDSLPSPVRIFNTRPTGKIGHPTGNADATVFNVNGKGGLPASGIGAVLLNVTVVDPEVGDEGGYVTVYPCTSGRPDASNINFTNNQIIANTVIAPVDTNGNICFYSYGRTHLLADVAGWFPT